MVCLWSKKLIAHFVRLVLLHFLRLIRKVPTERGTLSKCITGYKAMKRREWEPAYNTCWRCACVCTRVCVWPTHCCHRWVAIPPAPEGSAPLKPEWTRPGSKDGPSSGRTPPPTPSPRGLQPRHTEERQGGPIRQTPRWGRAPRPVIWRLSGLNQPGMALTN